MIDYGNRILQPLVIAIVASGITWLAWIGFTASDDIGYYQAAVGWLTQSWYVPMSHWQSRTAVAMPITVAMLLFGNLEFVQIIPSATYYVALLLFTYWRLAKLIPSTHAFAACLLLATLPVFPNKSVFASADIAEAFWAIVAFWAVISATRRPTGNALQFVGAGAAIGLSFLARETVVSLIVFIGVLFLAGYRVPRFQYLYSAAGFLFIAGSEALYYAIASGDPFHRIWIILDNLATVADRPPNVPPFTLDDTGTLRIWNPIDPIVLLFTKHEFGLAYYIMTPVAVMVVVNWLRRRKDRDAPEWLDQAALAVLAGLIWVIVTMIVLHKIMILSRYYMVPTYLFFVATVLWISHHLQPSRARIVVLAMVVLAVGNLAMISVSNKDPRPAERAVAEFLTISREPLTTDPLTHFRSEHLVMWAGQDFSRVSARPPAPGELYLYNPEALKHANPRIITEDVPRYRPAPSWEVVWMRQLQAPWIGRLVEFLGLGKLIPQQYRDKLSGERPKIIVYRVPK